MIITFMNLGVGGRRGKVDSQTQALSARLSIKAPRADEEAS